MDGAFAQPIRITNGETVVVLKTAQEVGAFMLQNLPPRRRRPKSFADAMTACVRAIGGSAEPEVARQLFLLALQDLAARPRK